MATSLKNISSDNGDVHVNKINYGMSYVTDLKLSAADAIAFDIRSETKALLEKMINQKIEELETRETKVVIEKNNKEINMNNAIKNVLFVAPSYPYAKTVVENVRKDLNRYGIPHTYSLATGNVYLKTEDVKVELVYLDPLKYTPDIFMNRDAVFGKKILVDGVVEKYPNVYIRRPTTSFIAYLREAYNYSRNRGVDPKIIENTKPRTTYLPEITNVYFNKPYTIVLWNDGTKTMVKCQEGDVYSKETGLALCVTKKAFGNMPNFNNVFRKWIPEEKVESDTSANTNVTFEEYADEARKILHEGFKKFFNR